MFTQYLHFEFPVKSELLLSDLIKKELSLKTNGRTSTIQVMKEKKVFFKHLYFCQNTVES